MDSNVCYNYSDLKLNDTWNLYFHAKNYNKNYADNTKHIIKIDNINDLWGTFNNFPKPTQMFTEYNVPQKTVKQTGDIPNALSLFRKSSYPQWEHITNVNGFEWSLRKQKAMYETNDIWFSLIALILGENYENSENINGIRIVDSSIENRIIYRFEVWFINKDHKDYFEKFLRTNLNVPIYTKLLYREHNTLKENKKE